MAEFETKLIQAIYEAARKAGITHLSSCPSMRVVMPEGEWEGMTMNVITGDEGSLWVQVVVSCDDGNSTLWTYGTLDEALAVGTASADDEMWNQ